MGHPVEDLDELIDTWMSDGVSGKSQFKQFRQELDEYLTEKQKDTDSYEEDAKAATARTVIPDSVVNALVRSGTFMQNRAQDLTLEDLWDILEGQSILIVGEGHK